MSEVVGYWKSQREWKNERNAPEDENGKVESEASFV